MRLLPGEAVVGAACVEPAATALLASHRGQIKRLRVDSLRVCQRGDLGQIGLRFLQRDDRLVDLQSAETAVIGVDLGEAGGRGLRLRVDQLTPEEPSGSGLALPLKPGDAVQELVPLIQG
jgi:DNA gyrase subunit A